MAINELIIYKVRLKPLFNEVIFYFYYDFEWMKFNTCRFVPFHRSRLRYLSRLTYSY